MTTPSEAPKVRKRNPHIVWLIALGGVAAVLAVAHWWTANNGPIPAEFVGKVVDGDWVGLPNLGLLGWAWFYAGAAALCWIGAIVVHAMARIADELYARLQTQK